MSSIKVYEVSGDTRPLNAISVWDASSSGIRPLNSIPVWKDTNNGDRPLNSIQVKIVDKALNAIPVWFNGGSEPGPGPEPLPPFTLRLKYKEGTTPTFSKGTGTLVDSTNNIWDLTYENSDWNSLLYSRKDLLEVINCNASGVTKMYGTFLDCNSLTSVKLYNTSNVTEMVCTFQGCTSLTSIPLFDTSSITNMSQAFDSCFNVKSGALELYQQVSSQLNPPSIHAYTFRDCGRDTQTGSAELAQIPGIWK